MNKRVMIAAGLDSAQEGVAPSFVTLQDPRTGQPSTYLLSGKLVQEVNWVKQQFSSYFVGDSVLQDGGLYICTPVDPLLLALPLLERARGAQQAQRGGAGAPEGLFCDLEEVLRDVQPPAAAAQLTSLLEAQLGCVCDAKAAGGQQYYRLNDAKVLAWLQRKVGQTKAALLGSPASVASYTSMDPQGLTAYAAGMLGEYLSPAWAGRLKQALGLPEDLAAATPAVRPPPPVDHAAEAARAEKRPKLDPKEAAKQKAAEARQAAKTAKLAKEAAGMRKLSSFFAPKPAAAK